MITRKCVICGKPFGSYPSDNRVTCSKDCRRERQRRITTAHPIKWGDEARRRAAKRGLTENLKLGSAAAQRSPISGRFETNQEAKIWTLVDPHGVEIVVRNLLLWARENTERFNKPPGDKSAKQIVAGIRAIAQTLAGKRGAPGKPRGSLTYFGWTLKKLPEEPPK